MSDPLQVISLNQFVLVSGNIIGVELVEASFLDAASLFALQSTLSSGFVVATIGFDTVGAGSTSLTTQVASAADENGNPLTLSTDTGGVTVTPLQPSTEAPEPGAILLLASGLLLLARRRAARG